MGLGKNKIRSVRIPSKTPVRKYENNNLKSNISKQKLSLGYGFVECILESDAYNIVKTQTQLRLDGYLLKLELSSSSRSRKDIIDDANPLEKVKQTKLMIRNVPFE